MFERYKEVDIGELDYDKEYYHCLFNYVQHEVDKMIEEKNYDMNYETINETAEYKRRLLDIQQKDDQNNYGLTELEEEVLCEKTIA